MRRHLQLLPEAFPDATIDTKTLSMVGDALEPSIDNYCEMIRFICDRKKWTHNFYAEYVGTTHATLNRILNNKQMPTGPLARLIFMVYMQQVAPSHLNDTTFVMTWGRSAMQQPKRDMNNAGFISKIIAEKKKMTLREIQLACAKEGRTPRSTDIISVCKKAGYKLVKKQVSTLLSPNKIWVKCDWRKSTKALSEEFSIDERHVRRTKAELRKMKKKDLVQAFLEAGRTELDVEILLRCHTKSGSFCRKVSSPTVSGSEPPAPSPQNTSETGSTSASQTDACAEIACQSELSDPGEGH